MQLLLLITSVLVFLNVCQGQVSKPRQSKTTCGTTPDTKSPKENIFKELSIYELESVHDWLMDKSELNLKKSEDADLKDNYIQLIDVWQPNKKDSMDYLDSNKNKPERKAKVNIVMGAESPPTIRTFTVGPLPISSRTKFEDVSGSIYHNTIPWNGKPSSAKESELRIAIMNETFAALSPCLEALLGKPWSYDNYDTGLLANNGDGSFRHPWVELMFSANDSAYWFMYTGFYANFDFSNQDINNWKLIKLVYDNKKWYDVDSFINDFNDGKISPTTKVNTQDTKWALRSRKEDKVRDLEHKLAPVTYSPDGLRYRLDDAERYITWLDWEFYISYSPETGLSVKDIKFKGERIAWEITLQEAVSNYGGSDPLQALTAYLDRGYEMGSGITPLVRGYDCSSEATYLPVSFYDSDSDSTTTKNDTICMFEKDLQKPISRHFQYSDSGSTKGVAFELRTINTVGNYDYIISYIFYPEGSIQMEVSASGYLQTTYYSPSGSNYDTRVSATSAGSIHDHVINFKVDLDILGLENSVEKKEITISDDKLPWMDDDEEPLKQKKIESSIINSEKDAIIDFNSNGNAFYLVGNQNEKNSYGNTRSYRIMPRSLIHNTVNGKKMEKNADFSTHDMFVLKRHENEQSSSSIFNAFLPSNPPIEFKKYYEDDENIKQEDLVIYLNLGFHHIPRSEDVPNTLTIEATSAIMLSPFNYADDELSRDLTNAYYAVANDDGYLVADENDVKIDDSNSCTLNFESLGTLPF